MRPVVIILGAVGIVFVAFLLLWPSTPATNSKPGFRPSLPGWLARLVPDPPAAVPLAGTALPSSLASGASWSGRFTAENRELGVVRIRLRSGAALKVTAREPGEEEQVLCIARGAAPPGGCKTDNMADGDAGGVIVRKGTATLSIEAPAGAVTFAINE